MMTQSAYLVMVNPYENNNKYYRMTMNSDGFSFTVEYGRVGANPQRKEYPAWRWRDIYMSKLSKGYTDASDLHTASAPVSQTISSQYKEIADKAVRELVDALLKAARQTVKANYKASVNEVTPAMIQAAKQWLSKLTPDLSVQAFNDILIRLFEVIPRRMSEVWDYLAKSESDYETIVARERDVLDALSGQVYTAGMTKLRSPEADKTILEVMGISIRPCTNRENAEIISHLTPESAMHFKAGFRVTNHEATKRLNAYVEKHHIKRCHYYYHGSGTRNYWNIIAQGLDINPNARACGKMFGMGSYFARRAKKSLRYTDLAGQNNVRSVSGDPAFLMVFKVAYKNAMHVSDHQSAYSVMTEAKMRANGYDCMYAHAGQVLLNDEIIVYNNAQSAPHYLIALQ